MGCGGMRKSRSLPSLHNSLARHPLCPPARPPGHPNRHLAGTFGDYRRPSDRWDLVNEKLSNLQSMEERSVWARDSYDIHRPLNQRLDRPRPEKIWQKNEVGNKRAFETMETANRQAAAASYDLYRPLAGGVHLGRCTAVLNMSPPLVCRSRECSDRSGPADPLVPLIATQ